MSPPRVQLPSLRGFLGAIACRKTTTVSAIRALFSLDGALTDSDQAVQDVVNAIVEELETIDGAYIVAFIANGLAAIDVATARVRALTAGLVKSDGSGNLSSASLVNADVSVTAAIAGSKISPDFGAQAVLTNGSITGGSILIGTTKITKGTGDPTGVVVGNIGDLFLRTNGGVGSTLYVKEANAGTSNGWSAK